MTAAPTGLVHHFFLILLLVALVIGVIMAYAVSRHDDQARDLRLQWTGEKGYDSDGVDPDFGAAGEYRFRVDYLDSQNTRPATIQVWVDTNDDSEYQPDEKYPLDSTDPDDADYRDGARYATNLELSHFGDGQLSYRFFASSDMDEAVGEPTASRFVTVTGDAPLLTWTAEPGYIIDGVNPDSGPAGDFVFRVDYRESANEAPTAIQVWIDSDDNGRFSAQEQYSLAPTDLFDLDMADGKRYSRTLPLSYAGDGNLSYRFYANDGADSAEGAPTAERTVIITRDDDASAWIPYSVAGAGTGYYVSSEDQDYSGGSSEPGGGQDEPGGGTPPDEPDVQDTTRPSSQVSTPQNGSMINGGAADPYIVRGTASDNVAVQRVEISTDGGYSWSLADCAGCSGSSVNWTFDWTLPVDGSFGVISRAIDTAGNVEAPVAGNSVIVDRTPPMHVTEPLVDALSATAIDLSWTPTQDTGGSGLAGYRVERAADSGGSPGAFSQFAVTADNSYEDASLSANSMYWYRLKAFDAAGNESHYCTCVFGYTLPAAPSLTADKTTATWYATTDVTFTNIAGFGPGGVQYYRYAWDQNPTHTFTDTETQWSSGTLTRTSLVTGSWYLHVKSYNSEGASNGTVDYGPYYYDGVAPTGLANQAPLNGAIDQATSVLVESGTATDPDSGQIQYYFEVARDSGFTTGLQASGWQSGTSFAPSLGNATTYYWHVKARDGVLNETSYTAAWSFTTTDVAPAAPSIGTPAALSATSIRWNFTDNAGNETGFKVHDALDNIKASSASPDLSFLDEAGLAANTSYTRHVHAYNGAGDSVASSSASIYTLPTAPSLTADKTVSTWYATADVTFTNIAGFGPGGVEYYRYAWDQTPTHSFTDTETQWSSGTQMKTANLNGGWYLHVKSYNADGAANGTTDYGPYNYDGSAPSVTSFTATTPSNSLNIPISSFAATDNIAVTGYQITTSPTAPPAGDSGWQGAAQANYTVAADGTYTLYPWAKDAAGNVSSVFATPQTVVVDTTPPTVDSTLPGNGATAVGLNSSVSVYFSEDVDCSTVNTSNITTSSGGWALSSCSGDQAVFSTSGQSNNTVYTVTVSTAVTDANGNHIASSHQFSYTTEMAGEGITVCATGCDYGTIQPAIDAASDGDTISVYEGTYSENINFNGKDITVQSVDDNDDPVIQGTGANSPVVTFSSGETSSAVLDGFTIDNQAGAGSLSRGISITGGSYPTISDCTIRGNEVVSTWVNGAGIYISGATAVITDTTFHQNSGSSGGAVYGTALTAPLAISNGSFTSNTARNGGAVYLASSGQPTVITGSTFSGNSATGQNGGAIYGNASAISLSGSTVTGNTSAQDGAGICMNGASAALTVYNGSHIDSNSGRYGGGIYGWTGSVISISDSSVDSNTSLSGGAIYLNATAGTSTFVNTSISGNSATDTHGGGIYSNSALSLDGCTVDGNSSTLDGAGIYLVGASAAASVNGGTVNNNTGRYGGGIYQGAGASLTVTDASINGNSAISGIGSGGGIYAVGTTLDVDGANIRGNRSSAYGGGIYNSGTAVSITNSIITGNTNDQQAYSDGGGIYSAGTLDVVNSTIAGNYTQRFGGGLRINSGTATVRNSIIWGNSSGGAGTQISGAPTVSYTDVQGGYSGGGNIDDDPLFIDFQQATAGNPTTLGDFHILEGSPCRNWASNPDAPADDIDGDIRPQEGFADMGADEFIADPGTPAAPTIGTPAALSATSIRWNFTDNAGNEDGFRVHDALDNIKASSASPDLSFLDEAGLAANTSYARHVHSYNDGEESTASASATAYTLPAAPSLTADKTVSTWYATADVTFTNIAGFGSGGVQYYRYAWDQTPTHSFTDTETQWSSGTLTRTSLVTGSWYLHVKSYNSEGASNGTVDYGPYYYDGVAPTGLANQAPLNGAIDQATSVSVESGTATDPDSGQIQYYFEVARDSGFTTGLQASGWQSGTSFAPSLGNATTYYWHVKARDGVLNETGYTAAWSFTTTDVPPAAPSIGTPAALSATSIRWNFTDNAGNETGFKVHDALDNIKASSASPDLSFLDEAGLAANTSYTRHVHAYNGAGDSVASSSASIYTLPAAPSLTADKTTYTWYATADVTFTNIAGFGPGGVEYYRYAWDQSPTHSFTDTETQWSSGTLTRTSTSSGSWYLHVKSYNADDAAGSAVDYGPYYYDGSAPSVTSFTATTPSNSLNIPISSFAATDNIAVTGYQITASATPPAAGGGGWSGSAPSTYTVASDGTYTLYPWAKDAAGNVSPVFGTPRTVLVDTTPPTVESSLPANGATGVALDGTVTIDFSEDVDCSTVNTTNITISSGGWALSSCSGDQAVFSTSGQSNNTVYTVTVSTAVTDVNGNPMASSYQFAYTTVAASGGGITVCATGCDFTTIQGAISDTGTIDGDIIQVSSGTYSENINFSGKDITVESVSGAAATKIQGAGGNSAVVTFAGGETTSAVLDGFTIDNQAAVGTLSRGISITASSSPTISDSVIEGNLISSGQNGAGIYISAGGATIENSTIGTVTSPNNSGGNAGGIYLTGGSGLSITGSTISYNVASSHGGGIYATGSGGALSITGSNISYNQAGLSGPGMYLTSKTVTTAITGTTINNNTSVQAGGGIFSSGSPLSISGSTIRNNTVSAAGQNGAGLYLTGAAATTTITSTDFTSNSASSAGGGGIYVAGDADLTFSGGSLNSNIAGSTSGGAIFATGAGTTVNVSGANIRGNDVAQYGGGIYIASTAQVSLTNCIVSGNTADGYTYSDGGGINNNGSTMNIMNCTFAGNYARRNGGGTYGAGTITNSIIWGNTAGTSGAQIYGTPTVTYSDIQGGFAGTGNINSDPLFVSLVQATLGNPTTAGDYHLSLITSLAVDAGSAAGAPGTDIDGNSRPQGLGYDMGADEFM